MVSLAARDAPPSYRKRGWEELHILTNATAHPDFYICRMATEEVLVAVLSFYGSHYRQASNLQVGLDCSSISSSKMRHSLTDAFQRARLDRGAFRKSPIIRKRCFRSGD